MKQRPIQTAKQAFAAVLALVVGVAADSPAPNPTTESHRGQYRLLTLSAASWTYQASEEPRELKLHDLVFVQVDEKTEVISEGEMDRRKKADSTFVLQDWIGFQGLSLKPDAQSEGDPAITGQMQSKYRSEAELETRDSMKFQIACHVVDVRPNGNLLIEGRKSIHNNSDVWELWLFGVIRADDVLPNNTVLSNNVDELRIVKRESGHVRDGYRRGWFSRWFDRVQPF